MNNISPLLNDKQFSPADRFLRITEPKPGQYNIEGVDITKYHQQFRIGQRIMKLLSEKKEPQEQGADRSQKVALTV